MTVVLISPILSPSIVGAITESTQSSETTTATESTTEQSASTASTEQTNASEAQEAENSIEETTAETNYEERELSDEVTESSPHPVVQLEEENRGNLLVQNENDQQITRLTKLILQTKQDEGEWQNKQEYEVEDNYNLSEIPYSFEYSAETSQRIIAEYSIEEYQDGRLVKRTKHMAHYLLEESEATEELSPPEDLEEISEVEDSLGEENTESTEKESVEQPNAETSSQESQEASQNSAAIPNYSSEENNPFKRSLRGISPQADLPQISQGTDPNRGTYKEYPGTGGDNSKSYTRIRKITKTSAVISGAYMYGSIYNRNDNYPIIVWRKVFKNYAPSVSEADITDNDTYKKTVSSYNADPRNKNWEVTIDGLDANTTYYFWFFQKSRTSNEYESMIGGCGDAQIGQAWGVPHGDAHRYSFKTQAALPLTKVNTPVFPQANVTATSIRMTGQSYTGDISQTNSNGKIHLTSDGTNFTTPVTNLGHTFGTGPGTSTDPQKYNDYTITGLQPGTRYKGKVTLLDYSGRNETTSGVPQNYVYTPNTVSTPDVVPPNSLGVPTTYNNATATITASYKASAGAAGADPANSWDNVKVEISTTSESTGFWEINNLSTNGRPSGTPSIDDSRKKVTFSISNLTAKKKYWVRCQVLNASGKWSGYPEEGREFTAKGRALSKISKPTFSNLTPTSARMNEGSYVGDVRSNDTVNGNIYINCNALSNPVVQTPAVSYQNTFSGKYFSRDITNLTPGTRYVTDVRLQNAEGGWVRSAITNDNGNGWAELITPNRVKKPVVTHDRPPTPTTGEASIKAEYEVGADPRGPSTRGVTDGISGKGVKVEIKEGNGPFISITEDSSSSPSTIRIKPNSLNINSGHTTPNVTFGLTGLKSKTTYTIQVSVKNASGVWSPVDNNNRQTFTTLGAVLSLSTPTFDLDSGNATSINQNQGSYLGDATAPDTVGRVFLRANDNANPPSPVVSNLQTLSSGNKYAGATLTNLLPGTKYSSRVEIRDYQQAYVASDWGSFVTPNELITNPIITKTTPTTSANAGVAIEGIYKAGGTNATAAHPNKLNIEISTDGINYEPLPDADSNTTGPKLSSNDVFDQTNKKINIGIDNLLEGTRYYIKYSVENERKKNNGDPFPSNEIQVDFVTLTRPSGLYINEVPEAFNFGTVELSENNMTHPLQSVSGGDNHVSVDFENINTNSQWTLSAKLSELQVSGGQQTLTGSKILMDKELKKTSDGGSTWDTPDSAKFDPGLGIQGSEISLPADGETSVPLFKATDIPYGIGHFENRIAKNSVRLFVPGNTGERGKTYSGSITWTMDNLI